MKTLTKIKRKNSEWTLTYTEDCEGRASKETVLKSYNTPQKEALAAWKALDKIFLELMDVNWDDVEPIGISRGRGSDGKPWFMITCYVKPRGDEGTSSNSPLCKEGYEVEIKKVFDLFSKFAEGDFQGKQQMLGDSEDSAEVIIPIDGHEGVPTKITSRKKP